MDTKREKQREYDRLRYLKRKALAAKLPPPPKEKTKEQKAIEYYNKLFNYK